MATIADVARHAGVTTATVSNVLTGRVAVRDATRQRVLHAIEELGYQPNLVARGLAQGKTMTIAVVVPTIKNPFFAEVIEEVEQIADQHDYQILLCTTNGSLEQGRRHIERLCNRWVDGFLIMGMATDMNDVLLAEQQKKPIVLSVWDHNDQTQVVPIVDIDFRSAGELATQHLITIGHRQIAAIVEDPVQHSRLEGYKIALARAGLPFNSTYVMNGDSSFESGYQAAQNLCNLDQPPTAIFAGNDMMALGAMEALNMRGYRIPTDISIVGVDDIALAKHAQPPLTTMSIPKREMARGATELLLRRINEPTKNEVPHTMLVRPNLVIRQSTAAI